MADWKQITARIRRARTSKDPAGQLSALYEKTHDAMVAFELAKYFETSAMNADAAKWYSTAAERFRRADWKTKAQEAAVRLGAEPGANASSAEASSLLLPVPVPEPGMPFEQSAAAFEAIVSDAVSELVSEQGGAVKSSLAETAAKTESSASEEGAESTGSSAEVDSDEENAGADAAGAEAVTVAKLVLQLMRRDPHVCRAPQTPVAAQQRRHPQHRPTRYPQRRSPHRKRGAQCRLCLSSRFQSPPLPDQEGATAIRDYPLEFRCWRCSSAACSVVKR